MDSPLIGIDHTRLCVQDLEASKAWYSKVLGTPPLLDLPGYVEYRIGASGLALTVADEKSPFSSGGQVAYWRVRKIKEAVHFFTSQGASLYRGPLAIENGEEICQMRDPFGNILGLIGSRN